MKGEEKAYARGLVHVDPSAVDVDSGLRVVEQLELLVPVAICAV